MRIDLSIELTFPNPPTPWRQETPSIDRLCFTLIKKPRLRAVAASHSKARCRQLWPS